MPNTVILVSEKSKKPPTLWTPARQENIKGTYLFVHTSHESETREDSKPEWIIAERQYGISCIPLTFTTKKFAIEVAKQWWSELPQTFIDWLSRVDMSYQVKSTPNKSYKKLFPDDFERCRIINKNIKFNYLYHPSVK